MTGEAVSPRETSPLNSGCSIWIIAEPARSAWARKIDWYLNFQIMRAELHAPREIPARIQQIADHAESELPKYTVPEKAPLLIAANSLVPAAAVVVVPWQDDLKSWVRTSLQLSQSLGAKSARVFLPDGVQVEPFVKEWRKSDNVPLVEAVSAERASPVH